MPELFNVLPPSDALALLRRNVPVRATVERLATASALGRFLAGDVQSPEDLPAFPRSAMDGFSVRARDTFGASEGLPAYFTIVGDLATGRPPTVAVREGEAVRAHTGGALAKDADAVVIVEHTQQVDATSIEVVRAVAPGENVVQVGEDVRKGDLVLAKGHRLRPQDLGGLLALGIVGVPVARRPRVAIVSTGDEVVPPTAKPGPAQVRDVNSYTLAGLTESAGGEPIAYEIVGDDEPALRHAAERALRDADIVAISAGSSVSTRDMTAQVIQSLGKPGILLHGVSLRPGKPTILAVVGDKPVFGLPGNPVSAMIVFDLFVRPAIAWLSGCAEAPAPPAVRATLARDVPSAAGREDYVPVRLVQRDGRLFAEPVFGKSNLIYTLVRADGIMQVPLDKAGLYAGDEVMVRPL
ncbi:MAG: molybdopterin molybdotransferase MoeA [Chloroflexi bacterium]|nr:molybdopterin molybdotransferase MoeA [Chloroflexota bacterium]